VLATGLNFFRYELLVSNAVASPGILTNQENSPKTASQLVKEATASYDKREYALAAKLFQEAVAKGATDRDTLYNTQSGAYVLMS